MVMIQKWKSAITKARTCIWWLKMQIMQLLKIILLVRMGLISIKLYRYLSLSLSLSTQMFSIDSQASFNFDSLSVGFAGRQ